MPCYDPNNTYAQGVIDGAIDADRSARAEFRHNSDVAQLLCEACKLLDDEDCLTYVSPELKQWWAEHQQRDAKR